MRLRPFVITLIILSFFGCSKQETTPNIQLDSKKIQLSDLYSNSGTAIAKDTTALKKILSRYVNTNEKIVIDQVEHIPTKRGYAALFHFKNKSGKTESIFLAKDIKFYAPYRKQSKLHVNHILERAGVQYAEIAADSNAGGFKCKGAVCCSVGWEIVNQEVWVICGCNGLCVVTSAEATTS